MTPYPGKVYYPACNISLENSRLYCLFSPSPIIPAGRQSRKPKNPRSAGTGIRPGLPRGHSTTPPAAGEDTGGCVDRISFQPAVDCPELPACLPQVARSDFQPPPHFRQCPHIFVQKTEKFLFFQPRRSAAGNRRDLHSPPFPSARPQNREALRSASKRGTPAGFPLRRMGLSPSGGRRSVFFRRPILSCPASYAAESVPKQPQRQSRCGC